MIIAVKFSILLSSHLRMHFQRAFRIPESLSTVTLALESFMLAFFSERVKAGPNWNGLINQGSNGYVPSLSKSDLIREFSTTSSGCARIYLFSALLNNEVVLSNFWNHDSSWKPSCHVQKYEICTNSSLSWHCAALLSTLIISFSFNTRSYNWNMSTI